MRNVRTLIFPLFFASSCVARAETLNFLNWEEYVSPQILQEWTKETGVEINQIYFDSGDDRDRLLADPAADIDIAIVNETVASLYARNNKLLQIDEKTVPNLRYTVPRWRTRCSGHGIPYFWGMLGVAYRPDKVATPVTSWSDLLKPQRAAWGHIAMSTSSDDLLTPALIQNGKPVSTTSLDDLKMAYDLLKEQTPAVKTYEYIITAAQDPKSGDELYMALAYSGDQHVLRKLTANDWRFAVPKEGSVLWVDCLAVNAHSPHKDLALKFLDFMNRPEIAAENAIYLNLPSTNQAAIPLMPEAMRNNPDVFPPEDVVARSQFYNEQPAEFIQLRKRIVSSLQKKVHDTQ